MFKSPCLSCSNMDLQSNSEIKVRAVSFCMAGLIIQLSSIRTIRQLFPLGRKCSSDPGEYPLTKVNVIIGNVQHPSKYIPLIGDIVMANFH